MSSFWRNFHHWLHWKLSFWQLSVQPVMKISSKWRHFRFSEHIAMDGTDTPIHVFSQLSWHYKHVRHGSEIILCMHPANERWRYNVTPSLIGWAQTQNDPWCFEAIIKSPATGEIPHARLAGYGRPLAYAGCKTICKPYKTHGVHFQT